MDSNKYLINKDVKEMLGLKDDVTTVKVDSISNSPFKTATPEQPKLNVTSHNATQQVVNNGSNETEVKQASCSTTTDQAPEQPASGSEVASPSGSQSTTADSNEPKSERIEAPTLEQPNSNNNILNQQPAETGGLFNNRGPQSDLNAGTKEIDNLRASAGDSTLNSDSSNFDIVSSQATTPDELQEPDKDKELARQSEADQKGHVETKNGQLKLVVSQDQKDLVLRSRNSCNREEFLVYITCDAGDFCITCVHYQDDIFHVNSVKPQSAEESVVTG